MTASAVSVVVPHASRRRQDGVAIALRGRLGNQLFAFAAARALVPDGGPVAVDAVTRPRGDLFAALRTGEVRSMTQAQLLRLVRPPRVAGGANGRRAVVQQWLAGAFTRVRDTSVVRDRTATRQFWEDVPPGGFDERFLGARPPLLLDGFFQNQRYFAGAEDRVLAALRPCSPEANAWTRDALARLGADRTPVAVLVRAGPDFVAYGWSLPFAWYRAARESVAARVLQPAFVLFSDSPFAREAAAAALGDLGPSVAVPALAPVDQLHTAARCQHAVIANSTFAWWAAWLGDHASGRDRARIVVAPDPWRPATDEIVATGWETQPVPLQDG